jgi:hypothetical protein
MLEAKEQLLTDGVRYLIFKERESFSDFKLRA